LVLSLTLAGGPGKAGGGQRLNGENLEVDDPTLSFFEYSAFAALIPFL
jgi:hypothetical protein